MKKYLALTLLLTVFCACQDKQPVPAEPVDALAIVGGVPITEEIFDEKAAMLDDDFQKYVNTPAGKGNFLNLIINEELLLKAAKDDGLDNSDQYIDEISALKAEQARALQAAQNFTLTRLLMEKLTQEGVISVSEDDIKAYYKRYPYQITLLQILMSDPEQAAAVMRAMSKVKSVAKFKEAVRQFSIDPATKKSGGQLPPFIPGEYMTQIEIPAANSPMFQPQGFIKTPQGFHIIMKVDEERLPYDKAKDRIKEILEKQKIDAYLNTLKTKYGVEVKDEVK
ncbi:MAG: peptidylprolyl isomerase [Elusimicrobiota bacterium]|jgi:parvulin-like peptidyl-prolyl isomerase|nr:peptidylprolyl isomerase [Elusimicrobiota bacterium]